MRAMRLIGGLQLERAGELRPLSKRPPRTCQWRWKIVCAAARADVDEHLVVVEPEGGAVRLRDEAEHPAGLVVREGVDVAERVDVSLPGSTSRCVSAIGLMSRIATKPSARARGRPPATSRQKRQSSGGDGKDPLLETPMARACRSWPTSASTSHGV